MGQITEIGIEGIRRIGDTFRNNRYRLDALREAEEERKFRKAQQLLEQEAALERMVRADELQQAATNRGYMADIEAGRALTPPGPEMREQVQIPVARPMQYSPTAAEGIMGRVPQPAGTTFPATQVTPGAPNILAAPEGMSIPGQAAHYRNVMPTAGGILGREATGEAGIQRASDAGIIDSSEFMGQNPTSEMMRDYIAGAEQRAQERGYRSPAEIAAYVWSTIRMHDPASGESEFQRQVQTDTQAQYEYSYQDMYWNLRNTGISHEDAVARTQGSFPSSQLSDEDVAGLKSTWGDIQSWRMRMMRGSGSRSPSTPQPQDSSRTRVLLGVDSNWSNAMSSALGLEPLFVPNPAMPGILQRTDLTSATENAIVDYFTQMEPVIMAAAMPYAIEVLLGGSPDIPEQYNEYAGYLHEYLSGLPEEEKNRIIQQYTSDQAD